MAPLAQPHDSLVRFTWSDLTTARKHFQEVLPAALVAQLDWSTLKQCPGTFIDATLQAFHSDLLFEVRDRQDSPLLLYLLFEHQSSVDAWMAFRILVYMVRIWEAHLKIHPKATKLPPVLPLVLYQGADRWTAPLKFEDLIVVTPELREILGPHFPRFEYLLEDLSTVADADLRGTALGRMALLLLKHASDGDIWQRFASWLDTVEEILSDQTNGLRAVEALFRYIVSITSIAPPSEVLEAVRARFGPQTEAKMMSWAEQLREEGTREGESKALRRSIVQALTLRFPKADWSDIVGLLASIDVSELEQVHADTQTASSARQFRVLWEGRRRTEA